MNTTLRPLAIAIALMNSPFALAADNAEPRELDAVTISASRSETRVEEMPLHTTVISRTEIEESPAQTLDQLLRNIPGMNFTGVPASQSDPTGHQTKMRGLGNSKVLVLLDGVPIHDPFYMTTQWFKLPLSNIERVEIVRGGNSSLWGNMAVAGVVNVVSKRVKDNAGEAMVSVGSRGTVNVAVSKNFAVSEALSFHLAADIYHTDGYQTTPSQYLWRFPHKGAVVTENRNVQLTTYFKPAADLSGFVRLGYHVQDQDISYENGSNVQRSPDFAANVTKAFGNASLSANAWAQQVRFEKYNGSSCYYQGGTSCVNSNSASLTPASVNSNIVEFYTQYGHQRYQEQGASLTYSQRLAGKWTGFEAGVDYRGLKAEDTEYFYTTPRSPANPQGNFNSTTSGEGRQTFTGLFGQTRVFPIDPLEITLSARYDTWRISDRANTRTTAAGVTTGGDLPASDKSAFNPSLALRYELTDAASLRAAAYKAFRAPGFNNLTRTFGTGTSTTIANPDLAPETLTGWEVGSDYRKGPLSLSATYFMYDIKDMIATYTAKAGSAPAQVQLICGGAALPGCGGSARYYTNDQDGRSHGIELSGSWRISHDLSLDAWYTRTETYLTRHGGIVTDPLRVQLAGVPKDLASIGANWKPTPRLRTFAEVRYIGAMLLDTTSNSSTMRFGQGSNTIVNASATYALEKSVDVFGSVVNLFDRGYSENTYAYNQPHNRTLSQPRTLTAGVRVRF